MELKTTVPPAAEPVTLAEAKLHLRVDHSDEDAYITALITASREWCESYLGGSICQQTKALITNHFPHYLRLPGGPVQSISSVTYEDENGDTQIVDASTYRLTGDGYISLAWGKSWPTGYACDVTITYVAGYPPEVTTELVEEEGEDPVEVETTDYAANVPASIKQAILLLVGALYEDREAGGVAPPGVRELLRPYREVSL